MKIYKPIEGILISRPRKGAPWWLVGIPSAFCALLVVYILVSGLSPDEEPQRIHIHGQTLADELTQGSLAQLKAHHAANPNPQTPPEPQEEEEEEEPAEYAPAPNSPLAETKPEPTPAPAPVANTGLARSPLDVAPEPGDSPTPDPEPAPAANTGLARSPLDVAPEPAETGLARSPLDAVEPKPKSTLSIVAQAEADREAAAAEAKKPKPPADPSKSFVKGKSGTIKAKLRSGQTIYTALTALQFEPAQIQSAINALGKVVDFRRSRPKDPFAVKYDKNGRVLELRYRVRPEIVKLARYDAPNATYITDEEAVPLETRLEVVTGELKTTLHVAMRGKKLSQVLINRYSDIFSYDINFSDESKPGDTFRLAYEKLYIDGKFIRIGRIMIAEYIGKEKKLRAYRFGDDRKEYYDSKGRSLRRMFMMAPVKGARLTSKFGPRFHPILKRNMPHNGVDYAAPTGTPIVAIAEGTVTFVGPKGATGNLVILKHPNGMQSLYAHMSRFAKGIKAGDKVKQGQRIGYVGSTGRSTGPHLHLAIKSEKGGFLDPLSVKSARGGSLRGKDLRQFRVKVRELDRHLKQALKKGAVTASKSN